ALGSQTDSQDVPGTAGNGEFLRVWRSGYLLLGAAVHQLLRFDSTIHVRSLPGISRDRPQLVGTRKPNTPDQLAAGSEHTHGCRLPDTGSCDERSIQRRTTTRGPGVGTRLPS